MKKLLFALALLPLLITGCSSDDDNLKVDFDQNLIYGEWRLTHLKTSSDDTYLDITTPAGEKAFEPTYITFKSGGKYSGKGYFGWGSGTFKANGKTIVTYIDGEEFLRYDVLSLTERNAEFIMHQAGSDSTIKGKLRKQ